MADLILPHFAVGSGDEIVIDGVTYKVPSIDSDGRIYVAIKSIDASEVKSTRKVTVDDSVTRVTIVAPTTGKAIRIISCLTISGSTTRSRFQVYFGTGGTISTNAGKEIMEGEIKLDETAYQSMIWPDGAGPVGAADDVLSLVANPNITNTGKCIVLYREE